MSRLLFTNHIYYMLNYRIEYHENTIWGQIAFMTILNEKQKELYPKLAPANIDPASFLATDYLNHFNEMLMMLEMLPDMPDMLEDLEDWAPKSYPDHFIQSGFTDKDLAVEAYENAPSAYKTQFDGTVADLDKLIVSTLGGLRAVGIAERGFSAPARLLLQTRIEMMHILLLRISGIIHGHLVKDDEITISTPASAEPDSSTQSQDDIDKLFD